MKTFFAAIVLSPLFFSISCGAQEPVELTSLRHNYQTKVERLVSPVREKYKRSLENLKKKLTKVGKLQEAFAVEEELKQLQSKPTKLRAALVSQKWIYETGKSHSQVTFHQNGTADVKGKTKRKWTWKIRYDSTLFVEFPDGNSIDFEFGDLSSLVVEGKTKIGDSTRRLRPIKK